MLSAHGLTQMVVGILGRAGENLEREGFVAHCVYGLGGKGYLVTALEVEDGPPRHDEGTGVLLVPSPMSAHVDLFRAVFTNANVLAAVEISEYWTFPHDDIDAALEYTAGRGVPPSQHPRRVEGVAVSAWWPMGGLALFESRRIVRAPTGAYLRPWTGQARQVQDALPSGRPGTPVSGWLEQCLPAPDDATARS